MNGNNMQKKKVASKKVRTPLGKIRISGKLIGFIILAIVLVIDFKFEQRQKEERKAQRAEELAEKERLEAELNKKPEPIIQNIVGNTFSGLLEEIEQVDLYTYTAPVTGIYYFACGIDQEVNGYYLKIMEEDETYLDRAYYQDGLMIECIKGEKYLLEVEPLSLNPDCKYSVEIHVPNDVESISGNRLSGQLTYSYQENWYLYAPKETGIYQFVPTVYDAESSFYYDVYEEDGSNMGSGVNDEVIIRELNAGETYKIKFMQAVGFPKYSMEILPWEEL